MVQSSSREALKDCSLPFAIQVPNTQTLPSKDLTIWWKRQTLTIITVTNIAIKVCISCHMIPVREVIIPGLADAEKIWREVSCTLRQDGT